MTRQRRVIIFLLAWVCVACVPVGQVAYDDSIYPPRPGAETRIEHTLVTGRPFEATFYAPEQATLWQLYPVVIDLHGCDGVHPIRSEKWRKQLNSIGVGFVVLDSFSGRGVQKVCDDVFRVSPTERVEDVRAFLEYVYSSPELSRYAWFLMGNSHGGTTVLLSSLHPDPIFQKVRGMVAYYPWCLDALPYINTDMLVLIGAADDWTPAARCRDMRVNAGPRDYELVIYPEATHSFDIDGIDITYYGHRLKHHPAATLDSVQRVLSFLVKHSR